VHKVHALSKAFLLKDVPKVKLQRAPGTGLPALQNRLGVGKEIVNRAKTVPNPRKLDDFFKAAKYLKFAVSSLEQPFVDRRISLRFQFQSFLQYFLA